MDVFTRSQDEHVPHVLHDLGYGNRVIHVPAGPDGPVAKRELVDHIPQFADGIKQFAAEKDLQYDLIHSHYWMSGLAAAALSDDWDVPIVHMFHTLGEMKNRIAKSEESGRTRIGCRARSRCSRGLTVSSPPPRPSKPSFSSCTKPTRRTVTIIPPGVDTSHFYPIPTDEAREYIGVDPDRKLVLFVGRIEPLKGLDTLIKAMSCQRTVSLGDVSLMIIGGDPHVSSQEMSAEMTRIQQLCDELSTGRMVAFLGKRAQETLPYYYSAADVLVMPSHYESFGMVALEAMACGTPVIASQVGGLAFLVKDGEDRLPRSGPGPRSSV